MRVDINVVVLQSMTSCCATLASVAPRGSSAQPLVALTLEPARKMKAVQLEVIETSPYEFEQ